MLTGNLVLLARSGESTAWHQLVDLLEGLVWSVVRGFRLSDPEAEDVAQLVWLKAVEHVDTIRDPERFGLWLATTARRECMRTIERSNRVRPVAPTDLRLNRIDQRDLASEVCSREDSAQVISALQTLNDDCRALLRLVLAEPAPSYAEISEILGIAVGTIGARRSRCLSKLRAAAQL